MFTPQQIEQISFSKAKFGGYNMEQVDEFLEPLTEDYVTLYKENALLKSKMRVLVGKREEYRKNETAMKEAVANAQATCDKMVSEAEAKCAEMLSNAGTAAAAAATTATASTEALVAAENARVEVARKAATAKINEIQEQMNACIQALERIKSANVPSEAAAEAAKVPFDYEAGVAMDTVASEISQSLEALVGSTVDTAPKAAPKHPVNDTTTSKFASLNLQFGRNYDVGRK